MRGCFHVARRKAFEGLQRTFDQDIETSHLRAYVFGELKSIVDRDFR